MLFSNDENLSLFESFCNSCPINLTDFYKKYPMNGSNLDYLFDIFIDINRVTEVIRNNPKPWDECCYITKRDYGERFISNIKYLIDPSIKTRNSYASILENTYLYCLYFVFEIDFKTTRDKSNTPNLGTTQILNVKKNINTLLENQVLPDNFKDNVIRVKSNISYELMKKLYHSEDIKSFKDFNDVKEQVDKKIEKTNSKIKEFDDEMKKREDRVKTLKDILSEQNSKFAFSELDKGFNRINTSKSKECKNLLLSLIAMGVIILLPLTASFFGWFPDNILKDNNPTSRFLKLVPLISIELLLIYYFRVILQNYKSTKAQILQIELRQSLCEFVQSYSDFTKTVYIEGQAINPLEKFENLIFSGIVADEDKLPSTFDGMDQITKLLTSLKRK